MNSVTLNKNQKPVWGIFLLAFLFPLLLKGQPDTIANAFKSAVQQNLLELGNQKYWLNGQIINPETEAAIAPSDLKNAWQKLAIPFFTGFENKASLYYSFLDTLPESQKQNLILFFSLYEKGTEQLLQEVGLPGTVKYLAPALSFMNSQFVAEDKRAGLWQLTHFQALLNGLEISKLVDERFVVSQSTRAAANQIKKNRDMFGSLDAAVAAYITSNVVVRNAMQQAENNEMNWSDFMPGKYHDKVAFFQAVSVFLYSHKMEEELLSQIKLDVDTITVEEKLHFAQISGVLQIPEKQLRVLNPQYKFSIVPGDVGHAEIYLPKQKKEDYISYRDSIYNAADSTLFQPVVQKIEYPPAPTRQYTGEPVKDLEIEGKTKIKYRLKTGDVLGIIAEKYDVRVADLKYWNNIFNERKIQAGKYLDIFVDDDKADFYSSLSPQIKSTSGALANTAGNPKRVPDPSKKIEHVVKSGESPYVIARQYEGVTPDDILEWNNINDARKIQIGQKLIVYLK